MGELLHVPFRADFLREVAHHVVTYSPETRSKVRVLLPHRRACRRLREILITESGAQILPRIFPLGELDAAEFALSEGGLALLPEVSSQTRRLLFAWLLKSARASDNAPGTIEQDSKFAHSLGQAIDRLQEFECSLDDLSVPENADYAAHWARAARFLEIVQHFWPNWCAEHQRLDPIARRNVALRAFAQQLGDDPVLIAGSSGRAVAVQHLMQAVLQTPQGKVFLHGTEILGSDVDIDLVMRTPSHPGFALVRLTAVLSQMPPSEPPLQPSSEMEFYRAVFRASGQSVTQGAVPLNVHAVVLPDRTSEIATTALLVREAFASDPESGVAVITQDTDFVDSLERWLLRWNIAVDRVAGQLLPRMAEGRLARLILEIWREGLNVVRLLAVLKHPLVRLGMARGMVWQRVARLEAAYLEGYDARSVERIFAKLDQEELAWLKPLKFLYKKPKNQTFSEFYILWESTYVLLCRDEESAVPDSRAAETLTNWWQSLSDSAAYLPKQSFSVADFVGLVVPMLETVRVPPPPRAMYAVTVLSAMEARLMRFDRVIVPMMNYGVLPASLAPEPWLTRQHYRDCGMPPPEETVGLAAHDFLELCHQPEVFLLRAEKIGDEVVATSSWWERFDAVYRFCVGRSMVDPAQNKLWQARLQALLQPSNNASPGRPTPRPPLAVRPKILRVTEVNALFLNPYDIYARRILRLESRPVRASETFAQRRGILFHQLVQDYVAAKPNGTIAERARWLRQHGNELIEAQDFCGLEALFLRFGVRRMAREFCAEDAGLGGMHNWLECDGCWEVAGIAVRGRADRIVQSVDGLLILDYKTGQLPSRSAVRERYEWQLPILALMAREGSFDGVPSGGRAAQLAYWRIGGSKGDRIWNLTRGEDQDDDFKELLNTVAVTFSARLRALGDRETPFSALPDPDQLPSHTNYAHLIRGEEWLDIVFDGIDGDDT